VKASWRIPRRSSGTSRSCVRCRGACRSPCGNDGRAEGCRTESKHGLPAPAELGVTACFSTWFHPGFPREELVDVTGAESPRRSSSITGPRRAGSPSAAAQGSRKAHTPESTADRNKAPQPKERWWKPDSAAPKTSARSGRHREIALVPAGQKQDRGAAAGELRSRARPPAGSGPVP